MGEEGDPRFPGLCARHMRRQSLPIPSICDEQLARASHRSMQVNEESEHCAAVRPIVPFLKLSPPQRVRRQERHPSGQQRPGAYTAARPECSMVARTVTAAPTEALPMVLWRGSRLHTGREGRGRGDGCSRVADRLGTRSEKADNRDSHGCGETESWCSGRAVGGTTDGPSSARRKILARSPRAMPPASPRTRHASARDPGFPRYCTASALTSSPLLTIHQPTRPCPPPKASRPRTRPRMWRGILPRSPKYSRGNPYTTPSVRPSIRWAYW